MAVSFNRRISTVAAALLVLAGSSTVAAAETVRMIVPVAVIYPGQDIDPATLSSEDFEVRADNAGLYALGERQLQGKVAIHTLLPGRPIALNAVRDPYLVRRGVATTLVFASGGLAIRAVGTALEPGGAGDFVRVRNGDSGQVVSGTVLADGSVRVGAQ